MTPYELKYYLKLPADIAERQKRIEKLQRILDDLPDEVQETVQSSTDAGEATIICHATVRGRASREPYASRLRELIAQQEAAQKQYTEALSDVIGFIESVADPEIRTIISVKYVKCGTWADCARALGNGATVDSVRMRFNRYYKSKCYKKGENKK